MVKFILYMFFNKFFEFSASIPLLKTSMDLGKPKGLEPFHADKFTPASNLLYPVPIDFRIFNPYEIGEEYRETNFVFTRFVKDI